MNMKTVPLYSLGSKVFYIQGHMDKTTDTGKDKYDNIKS